ncbi:MAG TPA: HEAT repeat domain-containing protein [Dongiaceae bacterium]|nr:HEAT repeat domain-containing protein [Dongiaceae bacterium]
MLTPETAVPPYADGEHWLRNELLDKLVSQPVLPADLAQLLVAIHQDTNQSPVMRDYAIQHVTPVYGQENGTEQAMLQATLWQTTQESDSGIAGTALLALQQLAQTDAGLERDRIGETALKLAGDDHASELARITAIQVCGRLTVTQAGPEALALAQDASQSTPLRLAAIATLGELGGAQVKPVLEQIAAGSEPRLKPAALVALQHLGQ